MEKIGNIGWFVTNEEFKKISECIDVFKEVSDKFDEKHNTEPVIRQWENPVDWTWRPWQAPWYVGRRYEDNPYFTKEWMENDNCQEYKIDDGEWWKHQPYCTSTTTSDPNMVRNTRTGMRTFFNRLTIG